LTTKEIRKKKKNRHLPTLCRFPAVVGATEMGFVHFTILFKKDKNKILIWTVEPFNCHMADIY
jgi:hypothetical protein